LKEYAAKSVDELNRLIEGFGENVLFRGQTSHYGEIGAPSVVTSFDRNRCIPSEMLKWWRYSQSVLDAYTSRHRTDFAYQQALLQHYGWRSSYVDCSSNPAVAAWFASHRYTEAPRLELCEDCDEQAVMVKKRMATYVPVIGTGHLYVLCKQAANLIGLVDLATLTVEGYRPRTVAQSAWLLGPLQNPIPQDCFLAQITVASDILQEYAATRGFTDTSALFPSPAEDPILKSLLGLPWEEIKSEAALKSLPAFKRALELPEYHRSFVKIAGAQTAFYRGAKILDTQDSIDGNPHGGIIVGIPDMVLYGSADPSEPLRFPEIEKLIKENGTVAFEADTLIKHPTLDHLTLYQKGVGVIPRGPDLFEVCEVTVKHPGLRLTGAGFTTGWTYRTQASGVWTREPQITDCSCDNPIVHSQHISALHIAEEFLKDPKGFV